MVESENSELMAILARRFAKNMHRHATVEWAAVRERLSGQPEKLRALAQMEATGGEPDVVGKADTDGSIVFCDCSPESPAGRRSLCYDREALESRKTNKPAGSATGMAQTMGVDILTEEQYRRLQALGEFDRKTSSWVVTPDPIQKLGGALFCDRRYDCVFVYHNGAESYYAARAFRARLIV